MYILGLNAYHADSSACIFKDGELIAATEEERFTRIKHWAGFPKQAIIFCLNEAGIELNDVDYITISRDPSVKKWNKLKYIISHPLSAGNILLDKLKSVKKVEGIEGKFREHFKLTPNANKPKIVNIEHHRSHLASAFFASPFEESAILSIDGAGDFSTTMLAKGIDKNIEVITSIDFPVSIGLIYTAFTQWLGFPYYGDEYKVMGLAPYGQPLYADKVRKIIKPLKNGLFSWKHTYFKGITVNYPNNMPFIPPYYSKKFIREFGPARKKDEELTQFHKDMASSVQKITEELIFKLLNHLHKLTGSENICVAGGVAQNSVANGKIIRNTPFKNVYLPSAGHDAGNAMGSALYMYNQKLQKPRISPLKHAYTGIRFTNNEIEEILKKKNLQYTKLSDEELYEKVVHKLIDAGVIGWYQGRAEYGPRALGNRSILVDPRRKDAKDLLNAKIKRRESFRPFAPSILREYANEYFEGADDVPFMEKVYPINKEKHEIIPAVTHVDGTGRLQTVHKETNPRYYALINKFREKTGIPVLLNTSFNENEPIVNTPDEAIDCFLRTKMDMLILENYVIERN